jgi:hypothetical protein
LLLILKQSAIAREFSRAAVPTRRMLFIVFTEPER